MTEDQVKADEFPFKTGRGKEVSVGSGNIIEGQRGSRRAHTANRLRPSTEVGKKKKKKETATTSGVRKRKQGRKNQSLKDRIIRHPEREKKCK